MYFFSIYCLLSQNDAYARSHKGLAVRQQRKSCCLVLSLCRLKLGLRCSLGAQNRTVRSTIVYSSTRNSPVRRALLRFFQAGIFFACVSSSNTTN